MVDSLINNGMLVCDNNLLFDYYCLFVDNCLFFGFDFSMNVDMIVKMRLEMFVVFL